MKPDDILNAIGEVDDAYIKKAHQKSFLKAVLVFAVIVIAGCVIARSTMPDFKLQLRYNPDSSVNTGYAEPEVLIQDKWTSMEYTAYLDGEVISTTKFQYTLYPNYVITHTENGETRKILGSNGDTLWPRDYLEKAHFANLYISTIHSTDLLERINRVYINSEVAYGVLNQQLNCIELEYFELGDRILRQRLFANGGTPEETLTGSRGYNYQNDTITGWSEWDPEGNLLAYAEYTYDGNTQTVHTYLADGTLTGTRVSRYSFGNLKWREHYDADGTLIGREEYHYRIWEVFFSLQGVVALIVIMSLAATAAFAVWDDRIQLGTKLIAEPTVQQGDKTRKPFSLNANVKRVFLFFGIFIAIVIIVVVICAPLIENHETEIPYTPSGYANTNSIMRELCVGDLEGIRGNIFRDYEDHEALHPEFVDPGIMDKLERYYKMLDGRMATHIVTIDYTLEGDYRNPPYTETSYMEITLDDNTILYAIVVFRQDADRCGVTDFDLYTECPW